MFTDDIHPRRKITNRSVWWVVGINFFLALILFYLSSKENRLSIFSVVLISMGTIAALSFVAMMISLFAVVIIQKQRYEPLIYFIGQLFVTAFFFALPVIGFFSAASEKIDNRKTLTLHDSQDTLRFQSLRQLENTLGDKSGLKIDIHYSECTVSKTGDSVCAIFLTYTTKQSPDETLTSKHLFTGVSGSIIYAGIPYRDNRELRKLKAGIDKVEEAVEDLKNNQPDSLSNNLQDTFKFN